MVNLRVVPGLSDVVSLPSDVVATPSDVVPLPRVLRDGGVLGLTVVKLWKTLVSVTVLWRVEKLSRMVLIRVDDVEEDGASVVGLTEPLEVVVVFFRDREDDFLILLAPKSFSTFVLFGLGGRPLLGLFFLLLFLVLFLWPLGLAEEFCLVSCLLSVGGGLVVVVVVWGLMSKSGITMDSPPILIVTGDPDLGLSVTVTPRFFCFLLLGSMLILGRLRIVLTTS